MLFYAIFFFQDYTIILSSFSADYGQFIFNQTFSSDGQCKSSAELIVSFRCVEGYVCSSKLHVLCFIDTNSINYQCFMSQPKQLSNYFDG